METLRLKIEDQKEVNENYLKDLGGTPKKELARLSKERFEENCHNKIKDL